MAARSFAHLVGLGRRPVAAAAAAEETEDERNDREEREDAATAERDEELQRRAENGEDTDESEDERRERESRQARRARRGRRAAEDEEDEGDDTSDQEEMRGHGTIAHARAHERGRIAAILSSPRAAANLPLAIELACNSTMSRDQALGVLGRTPPAARAERAGRNPQLGSGASLAAPAAGGGRDGHIQDMWGEAFSRVVPALRQQQTRGNHR